LHIGEILDAARSDRSRTVPSQDLVRQGKLAHGLTWGAIPHNRKTTISNSKVRASTQGPSLCQTRALNPGPEGPVAVSVIGPRANARDRRLPRPLTDNSRARRTSRQVSIEPGIEQSARLIRPLWRAILERRSKRLQKVALDRQERSRRSMYAKDLRSS
jgi:hypothetical protein